MKVKVWAEVATEVEADVSLGDILEGLDNLPDGERLAVTLRMISAAHGVLKQLSVEHIAEMDGQQRDFIGFVGIDKDGEKHYCDVRCHDNGTYSICSSTLKFEDMIGWIRRP